MKIMRLQSRYLLLISVFILLVLYSLFQARAYIFGPQVWIESPRDGQTVENPVVMVSGRSRYIAWISLNGRQIFTDENGNWSEKLIVSSGVSIMAVEARDRFGHEIRKSLTIVLK